MAEPGIQNLLSIGRTDRADAVRGLDRTFHQVHAAVKFDDRGVILRQAQNVLQKLHTVFALVLNIMNGKQGLDPLIPIIIGIE